MSRHLGMVVCSPPGAALCFEAACGFGAGLPGGAPEISLHAHPFAEYKSRVDDGDWPGVADLMLHSARILERAGAQLLIAPCNTIHGAFDLLVDRSPLPWIHIAEPVAAAAIEAGYRCIGILGTQATMEGAIYSERLAKHQIARLTPPAPRRAVIDSIIFGELLNGIASEGARAYLQEVIDELAVEGCDAIGLCCTELPLAISEEDSSLPLLDSTRLLAIAAVQCLAAMEPDPVAVSTSGRSEPEAGCAFGG